MNRSRARWPWRTGRPSAGLYVLSLIVQVYLPAGPGPGPLSTRSWVLSVVRSWLSRPCVWIPEPGPRHLDILDTLLGAQPSVRLVTDAHLAAIAIEHGLERSSRHRDFARWSDLGLRSRGPLA